MAHFGSDAVPEESVRLELRCSELLGAGTSGKVHGLDASLDGLRYAVKIIELPQRALKPGVRAYDDDGEQQDERVRVDGRTDVLAPDASVEPAPAWVRTNVSIAHAV